MELTTQQRKQLDEDMSRDQAALDHAWFMDQPYYPLLVRWLRMKYQMKHGLNLWDVLTSPVYGMDD